MKVAVDTVEMQPDHQTTIPLNELNQMIADQKGVTIDELALQPNVPAKSEATPVASMQTADINYTKRRWCTNRRVISSTVSLTSRCTF